MSTTRGSCRRPRSTPLSRTGSPKIAVVGTTGSGKTTAAKRLAAHHGVPHVELDALHWGPNWSEPTAEEFRAKVDAALTEGGWVADGGYHRKLGDFILERADLVLWLDLPLATILGRTLLRTMRRIRTQEELWNGNRERWRGFFAPDAPLVWALRTHRPRRRRYENRLARFNTVRLRSPDDIEAWLSRFA